MVRVCTNIGLVKVFLDSENCNYALILYIECHTLVNVKQCYYLGMCFLKCTFGRNPSQIISFWFDSLWRFLLHGQRLEKSPLTCLTFTSQLFFSYWMLTFIFRIILLFISFVSDISLTCLTFISPICLHFSPSRLIFPFTSDISLTRVFYYLYLPRRCCDSHQGASCVSDWRHVDTGPGTATGVYRSACCTMLQNQRILALCETDRVQ